jgi:hypothetical protein
MIGMRKRIVLIVLTILGLGLVATGLSSLYRQDEYTNFTGRLATYKVFYGFPVGWYGYSELVGGAPILNPIYVYWYSALSFLLDIAFWIAISSIGCFVILRSVSRLDRTKNLQRFVLY